MGFSFLLIISMMFPEILKAENEKWNIYKNYDYWKYPTIAITRNTSLEGHRVRTEITCSGTYLSAKLIYSYPSDWKNTDIRKKLILEKESELQVIYQENQDLKKEIELLKNNEDHIKKIAEEDLGLIKKDEEKPE